MTTGARAHAHSFTSLPAGVTPRGTPDRKNMYRTEVQTLVEPQQKKNKLWTNSAEQLVCTSETCNPDFKSYFGGNVRGVCVVCLPFGPVGKQTTEISQPCCETAVRQGTHLPLDLSVLIIHLGVTELCCKPFMRVAKFIELHGL